MRRAFLLFLLLLPLFQLAARADITSYHVDISVDSARDMHIREEITLEYTTPSHGFLRDIQYRFGTLRAGVENIVTSPQAAIERDRDYITLRFGDMEHLLTGGPYDYSIEYDYSLGGDSYPDYDEVFYNIVTPEAWESGMDSVSFSLSLPYPVASGNIHLTYGPYGSDSLLPFVLSEDGRTISGNYQNLPYGYGITIRVEMEEGYFNEADTPFNPLLLSFSISLILSLCMVTATAVIWYRKGRDEKLIFPVRFDPPEGLNPMETGFLYNGGFENSAVSSMLIYWADRGLISISEDEKHDFAITKLSEIPDTAPDSEKQLFQAFFSSSSSVDAETLRASGFPAKLCSVRRSLEASYTGDKALATPESASLRKLVSKLLVIPVVLNAVATTLVFPGFMTLFVLIPSLMAYFSFQKAATDAERRMRSSGFSLRFFMPAVFMLVFLTVFITTALSSSAVPVPFALIETSVFLLSLLVSLSFAVAINRRSAFLERELSEILGYREFIDKVEKERIEKLAASDPEYFYHVLSYAMALGIDESWTAKFEDFYVAPPHWYSGSGDCFFIAGFGRRWDRIYSSTIAPQNQARGGARTARGSSGFSGGGFSGGGGRSW